jgi:hypothetical protein
MVRIYLVAERLAAFKEGLNSVEIFSLFLGWLATIKTNTSKIPGNPQVQTLERKLRTTDHDISLMIII